MIYSILAGVGSAALLVLIIVNHRWIARRIPLVFLCAILIILWVITPAQLSDLFVAMVDQGEYGRIVSGFFVLALAPFVIFVIRIGDTQLSKYDTAVCLLPSVALAILGAVSSPVSACLSFPAILAGWTVARWWPLASPNIVSGRNKLLAVFGLLYAALLLYLAFDPIRLPIALGPIVIFSLGLALLSLILTAAMNYPVPALGLLLVWLGIAAFEKGSATISVGKGQVGRSASQALEVWLAARLDLVERYQKAKQPLPLVIMSAEGGGIYAAVHSLLGYQALTHYCPKLKKHVFATIGVSGGALGFVMERALSGPRTDTKCLSDPAPKAVPDAATKDLVSKDLLSPVLANLLLRQPVAWMMPFWNTLPDGGSALADALSIALGPALQKLTNKPEEAAMLFVTTDAHDGSRVVFSPIRFTGSGDVQTFSIVETQANAEVHDTIIQAAVTSARFPFLTQSAVLDGDTPRVLVDGGYSDNTGALTASNLISELKSVRSVKWGRDGCDSLEPVFAEKFSVQADWPKCRLPIFLAHVAFAADSTPDERHGANPKIADPFRALLGARVAEARRALTALEERLRNPTLDGSGHVDNGFYAHRIAQEELALPLGWRLSQTRAGALSNDIAPIELCSRELKEGKRSAKSEQDEKASSKQDGKILSSEQVRQNAVRRRTGCSMRVLMRLFDTEDEISIDSFN